MKISKYLLCVFATIVIVFISCSAIKNTAESPDHKLRNALLEGKSFNGKDMIFTEAIDFAEIFNSDEGMSIYIDSELRFVQCRFKGEISFKNQENRKLNFRKDIVFEDCIFEKEIVINDAVFAGRLQIGKCLIEKSLDIQRNSYLLNCRIDENEIGQDLIIQYSNCHEGLSAFGNSIGNHLLMQGISVQGKTQLSNLRLTGSVDLSNAHFHEDFMMDYATGGKKVLAGNSKFFSRCFLRNLDNFDRVDFSESYFLGKWQYSFKKDPIPTDTTNIYHISDRQ